MAEIVKSTCGNCQMACGMLINVEDPRPIRIEGDPDHPVNKGVLCVKGQASLELLYNPNPKERLMPGKNLEPDVKRALKNHNMEREESWEIPNYTY